MNFILYALIICGAASLAMFLLNRDRNGSVKALLYKTMTSFIFIAVAFASFLLNYNSGVTLFYMLVVMGLVCGLIGDILLDLKIMYKESSSLYQHGGMIAFFIGHIFYLYALISYFGFNPIPLIAASILTVVILFVSTMILKFRFKEHTIHTVLYSFVLSYFMAQACYVAYNTGFSACGVILSAGSVLFLLSDLVLCMTYYDNKDSRLFISVNHILYYAAQYLIAVSIYFMTA